MSAYEEKCTACVRKDTPQRIEKNCDNVFVQCESGCRFRFHFQCWEKKSFKKGGIYEVSKKEKFKAGAICESSVHKSGGKARIVRAQLWQNGVCTKTYFDVSTPNNMTDVDEDLVEMAKKIFFETILHDLAKIWRKKSGRDSRIFFDGHYTLRKLKLARQGGKESLFYWGMFEERWKNLNINQQHSYTDQARAELRDAQKKREQRKAKPAPPIGSPSSAKKKKLKTKPLSKTKTDKWISYAEQNDEADEIAQRYIRAAPRMNYRSPFDEDENEKKIQKPSDLKDVSAFPSLKKSGSSKKSSGKKAHSGKSSGNKKRSHSEEKSGGKGGSRTGSWGQSPQIVSDSLVSPHFNQHGQSREFSQDSSVQWNNDRIDNSLPEPWEAVACPESGETYYWNTATDETSWERPGPPPQKSSPPHVVIPPPNNNSGDRIPMRQQHENSIPSNNPPQHAHDQHSKPQQQHSNPQQQHHRVGSGERALSRGSDIDTHSLLSYQSHPEGSPPAREIRRALQRESPIDRSSVGSSGGDRLSTWQASYTFEAREKAHAASGSGQREREVREPHVNPAGSTMQHNQQLMQVKVELNAARVKIRKQDAKIHQQEMLIQELKLMLRTKDRHLADGEQTTKDLLVELDRLTVANERLQSHQLRDHRGLGGFN